MRKFVIVFLFSIVLASCSDEPVIPTGYENLLGEWESYMFENVYTQLEGNSQVTHFETFSSDSIPFLLKMLLVDGEIKFYMDNTLVYDLQFDEYSFYYDGLINFTACAFSKNGSSKFEFFYDHDTNEIEIREGNYPVNSTIISGHYEIHLRKVN